MLAHAFRNAVPDCRYFIGRNGMVQRANFQVIRHALVPLRQWRAIVLADEFDKGEIRRPQLD